MKENLCRAYEIFAKKNKLAIESKKLCKIKKPNIALGKEGSLLAD
jgi:hypothetical protein